MQRTPLKIVLLSVMLSCSIQAALQEKLDGAAHPAGGHRGSRLPSLLSGPGRLERRQSEQPSGRDLSFPAYLSHHLGIAGGHGSSSAARSPLLLLIPSLKKQCAALAAIQPDIQHHLSSSILPLLRQIQAKQGDMSSEQLLLRLKAEDNTQTILDEFRSLKSVSLHVQDLLETFQYEFDHLHSLQAHILMLKTGQNSILKDINTLEIALRDIQITLDKLDGIETNVVNLVSSVTRLSGSLDQLNSVVGNIDMQVSTLLQRQCTDGATLRQDGQCYSCPPLTILHSDNNCYYLSPTKRNRESASAWCPNSDLGNLATMTAVNRQLLYRLANTANEPRVWIGLRKEAGEPFKWDDNSPFGFTDWPGSPPNVDTLERCVVANAEEDMGKWGDVLCSSGELQFICQTPAVIV